MAQENREQVMDPVCGMTFRVGKAAATVQHAGRNYYFCSHACHKQFLEAPEKYARPDAD